MKIETIRALYVYTAAVGTLLGGFVFLYTYREPDAQDVRLIVSGLMGAAVAFLFNAESATTASRASERATRAGSDVAGLAVTGGRGGLAPHVHPYVPPATTGPLHPADADPLDVTPSG